MKHRLLLCCDLDRTLLPNGTQPESPGARNLFREVVKVPAIDLAYVSGRDIGLLQQAITQYQLPSPQFAVGDVGSTIYCIDDNGWAPLQSWSAAIAADWQGCGMEELQAWCSEFSELTIQEPQRQNRFKLSYYTDPGVDWKRLIAKIGMRLEQHHVRAGIVWSLDEAAGAGLLDILPASATKLHAIRFLLQQTGIPDSRLLFAGDSGNDLPVLVSGIPSVLVANATPEVQREAQSILKNKGLSGQLYIAHGDFLGMNGNYAAGVLEGMAHFFPETLDLMKA